VAFSMDTGKVSSIIQSSVGYHIIEVTDKRTQNGVDQVRIGQIFEPTPNFSDWLCQQEKNYNIHILIRNYYWDANSCSVEFRDASMRDFENNLAKNSPNDPSVMF